MPPPRLADRGLASDIVQLFRSRRIVGFGVLSALVCASCTTSEPYVVPDDSPPTESAAGETSPATVGPDVEDEADEVVLEEVSPWRPLGEPGVGGQITALAYDPYDTGRLLVGGDMLGIGLRPEPGAAWEITTGLQNWEIGDITYSSEPGVVWAGTMGGPYRSDDGGATWESRRSGMPDALTDAYTVPIETVVEDPVVADRLLAFGGSQRLWQPATADGRDYGSVWESTDDGASWQRISEIDGGPIITAAVYPTSETLLVATATSGVFRSSDGGRSWERSSAGLDHDVISDLSASPDGVVLLAALGAAGPQEPGGVFRSTDGGATWTAASDGLSRVGDQNVNRTSSYAQVVISPSDPEIAYTGDVAIGSSNTFRSDDGGLTWSVLSATESDRLAYYRARVAPVTIGVDPGDPDRLVIGTDEEILATDDGGESWVDLAAVEVGDGYAGAGYSGLVANDVEFDPSDPSRIAISAFDAGNLVVSGDGGASWLRPLQEWGGGTETVFAASAPGRLYSLWGQSTAGFRGVVRSDDGGETVEVTPGGTAGLPADSQDQKPTGLTVNPADADQVAIVVSGSVYLSGDGAESFESVATPVGTAEDVVWNDDGLLYLSGAGGVAVSADGGQSFGMLAGSPSDGERLTVDGDVVYLARYDSEFGGLWRMDAAGEWTQIWDDQGAHEVAVHPLDPDVLVAVSTDRPNSDVTIGTGVWLSSDGGRSWTDVNEGLPMTRAVTVAFEPVSGSEVVVGLAGRGYYRASTDDLMSIS